MSFDTLTIQAFIATAELKSFTKAAESISRTQSAVSQQMHKLEELVGTALFNRGREVTLTPKGEIFLGYAKRIFALQREAIDFFREPELQGEVRFGLPEDFASLLLADVLTDFARLHPRIQLHVECDLTLNLVNRFKANEFDLVLLKISRPDDFPNGVEVWSEPLEWVGDPRLLKREQAIPLVLSPAPCVYRHRAISALDGQGGAWRIALASDSFASKIAAVKAGLGITVLPRNMIPGGLRAIHGKKELPSLSNAHISLLKTHVEHPAIDSLEESILERFRR